SLDGAHLVRWPLARMQTMVRAAALLRVVQHPDARVEDTAEVTLRLYDLLVEVPNVIVDQDEPWSELSEEDIALDMLPSGGKAGATGGDPESMEAGEGELDYESPDAPDFRGDFKPELVQLLMRMRADAKDMGEMDSQFAPLTPEQLQELLDKSVEIDI